MSDDAGETEHHAICPLCVRVVSKESREELTEVVESHNEARHGDEAVAEIVTGGGLDDFMDRVEAQYGSDVYGEIGTHIVEADPWGVL